jgi:hypothetical protein
MDPESLRQLFEKSRAGGAQLASALAEVETYCMFIGYPRSGHSLTGSLLDAHEEMTIAHELDALAFVDAGFDWAQLCWLIVAKAQKFTADGRSWRGFDYQVPGGAHGRWTRLRVIGDKKGGTSTMRLGKKFGLLDRLRAIVPVPIKFVHVMRNPFDNIATQARYMRRSAADMVDAYFSWHATNLKVAATLPPNEIFHVHHEDFVASPRERLAELCTFLGVAAPKSFLDACASIVFERPRRSRDGAGWDPAMIAEVERRCAQSPFLRRYRYDN